MTVWHLLWGIGKIMLMAAAGASIVAWILVQIGFFDEWCWTCDKRLRDPSKMVKVRDETYCLACYKERAGEDGKLVGRCESCQQEMSVACMVGRHDDWICQPCWVKRLWPKDWYRKKN